MQRGKTIVFIDNSNIFHGQVRANWRVDYRKLHAFMEREGSIWQVFVFASVKEPPRFEQTEFYKFLKAEMRYEVALFSLGTKTYRCYKCGNRWTSYIEKGVDVALATKLLTLANNRSFETAILIGPDRDFHGTVQAVKAQGLRVEIYAWKGTISKEMENESSSPVVYFDDIKSDIEQIGEPDEEAEKQVGSEETIHEDES